MKDFSSFNELKKALKKDVTNYPIIKVALVGDTATQFLSTAIRGTGIECGYAIDLFEADYNQVELQVLNKNSELHTFHADYTIIFQSTHKLLEKYSLASLESRSKISNERLEFIRTLCETVEGRIIYFNYPEIEDGVFGSYANKVEASFSYQIRKLNYELMELARQIPNLFICDLSAVQNKFGRNFMFDAMVYTTTEMILSLDAIPLVAKRVMDIIMALQGKFKKCLILDLDNTLWGGVIGDDGLEGIQLGHGLGIGKAFTEFQMWMKKMKDRGIIICVCSKNDEEKAKGPFLKHPDMVLRMEDISVFMANWETKVDNIRQIQQILNIGFDSMVFLDDNPFERNMVREHIPDIQVPELPEDPAEYLEYIYGLNLFETAAYSELDNDRTRQYQAQAQRTTFSKTFTNEMDFLKSLNMVALVEGFTKYNMPRVAQLSQRSNQFNLRTKRYTEADIEQMVNAPKIFPLTFSLQDKFGDNGLIAVVIMMENDEDTLFVDTWFMSCRVLKRGMEGFTLNQMVNLARKYGYKKIVGEYLPTAKNGMVRGLYPNLGFSPICGVNGDRFVLKVSEYQDKQCFIKIADAL